MTQADNTTNQFISKQHRSFYSLRGVNLIKVITFTRNNIKLIKHSSAFLSKNLI